MRFPRHPSRCAAAPALALLLTCATLVAACGADPNASPNKPTLSGTPVNGAYQAASTHPDGHYESLVADGGTLYAGSDNGNVYAFDAASGAMRWHHDTGNSAFVYGVADNVVVALSVGENTSTILALAAPDGHMLWQRPEPPNNAGGEPLVVNGTLYIPATPVNGPGTVLALAPTSGAQLWQYTTRDSISGFGGEANGVLYVSTSDPHSALQTLVALDMATGRLLWSYSPPEESSGPISPYAGPVVSGGALYLSIDAAANGQVTAGLLIALDAATGRQLWRFSATGDNFATSPVVADGVAYAVGGNSVYAVRSADGRLLWRAPSNAAREGGPQNGVIPLVGDGGVYYAAGLGTITALRASDGSQMWQQHINNSVLGMVEESGRLDVATQLNSVYALAANDGHLLWQQPTGIYNTWDPGAPPFIVVGGVVYTGTDHGIVQAIRASDGHELWHYAIAPKAVPPDPVYSAAVTFDPSVPYDTALRELADLSLQPIHLCVWKNWVWQSPDYKANWAQGDTQLAVAASVSSPPGWLLPLGKLPGIHDIQSNPFASCPNMGYNAPPVGAATYLPPGEAGTVVRVRFAAASPYSAALDTITELGFRLGDPCYERQPAGAPVAWHPMGQEQSYAASHALIVVTTEQNSTQWERQARASTGAAGVDVDPTLPC